MNYINGVLMSETTDEDLVKRKFTGLIGLQVHVMAKMKVLTGGKWLWTRTIGSTVVGQGVDSLLFYPIAFAGIWSFDTLLAVVLFNWGFKIAVEIVMTPATYIIVNRLKQAEHEDYYDQQTDFTPFSLKV